MPRLPALPPTDAALVARGKILFERKVGKDSCAGCHAGKPGRAIPALWNVASFKTWGRDGHAKSLDAITREMLKDFMNVPVVDDEVKALVEYTTARTCANTKYDRYAAGEKTALDETERRGFDLFVGKGECQVCHPPPSFSAAMAKEVYFNTGVGDDPIKPPTLRDVRRTSPYMHDGSIQTLTDAVRMMASGGIPNEHLNPAMVDRRLTDAEVGDIVLFLGALDCE